jgi:hypothetical protein
MLSKVMPMSIWMGDHSRISAGDGNYDALPGPERAVCTTFLIQCPYWPKRGINPHIFLLQPTRFDSENVGSVFLLKVGNIVHIHTAKQPKNKINKYYKAILVILSNMFCFMQTGL